MIGTGTRLFCARAKARERCWPSTIQAARSPSGRSGIVSVPDLPTSIRPLGFGPRDPSNATSGERARIIALGNNVGPLSRNSTMERTCSDLLALKALQLAFIAMAAADIRHLRDVAAIEQESADTDI